MGTSKRIKMKNRVLELNMVLDFGRGGTLVFASVDD